MMVAGRPEGRPLRLAAAFAIVATAAVMYAPTIHDYFLQDDFGVVGLFSQRSLAMFPRWFVAPWTEDIWGYVPDEIRPFPAASYVVASWFGAAAPEPNHVLNIAIHAFNGLLVMWIAESAAGLGVAAAAAAGVTFVLLPIQAESVAWITGRVDSLPSCLYFASFLLYVRWRRGAGLTAYATSVALFVAALFSKQNTITMAPALMAFDWIVRAGGAGGTGTASGASGAGGVRGWGRYVPYLVLTVAFLLLRYALFHEVARESTLNAQRLHEFLSDCSKHVVRLVFGGPGMREWGMRDTAWIAVAAVVFIALAIRAAATSLWRPALYFGVVWMAIGMAPILVSGYYSPRHMYLASLGWAVTIGIAVELLWRFSMQPDATAGLHDRAAHVGRDVLPRIVARWASVAVTIALFAAYGVQLRGVVRDWNRRADISRAAVEQIEREASSAPPRALIIAGVPGASWNFAIPHALRPPFTPTDLTAHVLVISDSSDHCCDAPHWTAYTQDALHAWQAAHAPAIALYWDSRTGTMSRVSDERDPQLRTLVSLLLQANSRQTLDAEIRGLLSDYVALR